MFGRNLCLLLRREGVPRDVWPQTVKDWLGCGEQRAVDLLFGKPPSPGELATLAERFGYEQEELRLQDMTLGLHVLQENVAYLLDTLEHGKKKELAAFVGVVPQTVTSWLKGSPPEGPNRDRLKEYFGLGQDVDLERDPLFLSPYPLIEQDQRRWLRNQIERLDAETLRALFPAFRRLLRDE